MTLAELTTMRAVMHDAWLELGGCEECSGLGDAFGCTKPGCTVESRRLTGVDPQLARVPTFDQVFVTNAQMGIDAWEDARATVELRAMDARRLRQLLHFLGVWRRP